VSTTYPSQSPEYKRAYEFSRRLKQFDMTREQYDAMVIAQSGLCAICDRQLRRPCIDHSRVTGQVRGLLCQDCNGGIGLLGDDFERVKRAVEYLKRWPAALDADA
jgi:hypothetical protein